MDLNDPHHTGGAFPEGAVWQMWSRPGRLKGKESAGTREYHIM